MLAGASLRRFDNSLMTPCIVANLVSSFIASSAAHAGFAQLMSPMGHCSNDLHPCLWLAVQAACPLVLLLVVLVPAHTATCSPATVAAAVGAGACLHSAHPAHAAAPTLPLSLLAAPEGAAAAAAAGRLPMLPAAAMQHAPALPVRRPAALWQGPLVPRSPTRLGVLEVEVVPGELVSHD